MSIRFQLKKEKLLSEKQLKALTHLYLQWMNFLEGMKVEEGRSLDENTSSQFDK